MTDIAEGPDIAVGIDPNGRWLLPLAWAADEAHRRNVRLRLVLALPSPHDTERVVDDTAQHNAVRHASSEALEEAAVWARERHPGTELATVLRDGYPAPVLCGTSRHARMVGLGSQAADHAWPWLWADGAGVVTPASGSDRSSTGCCTARTALSSLSRAGERAPSPRSWATA